MKLVRAVPLVVGLAALALQSGSAQAQYNIPYYEFSSVAVDYPVDTTINPPRLYSLQGTGGQTFATVDPPTNTGQTLAYAGFFETAVKFAYKGHVNLENFGGAISTIPLNVRFYSGFDGTLADTQNGFADNSGNFTVMSWTNPAPIINGTTYLSALSTKGSHFLRRHVVPTQPSDPSTGYPTATFNLLNGDVNGDNQVDLDDLGQLAAAFNTVPGDPAYDSHAELTGDNSIDLDDLGALALNFNVQGDDFP